MTAPVADLLDAVPTLALDHAGHGVLRVCRSTDLLIVGEGAGEVFLRQLVVGDGEGHDADPGEQVLVVRAQGTGDLDAEPDAHELASF